MPRELAYPGDYVLEHIPVVVALVAVDGHHQTLEAHAGIHMPVRQLLQSSVGFAVVLDEHQVPYLYHQRVALIDQVPAGHCLTVGLVAQVDMYLAAGAAGAGVTHLPEIVLLAAVKYPVLRQILPPDIQSLFVRTQSILRAAFADSGIETLRVELVDLRQQFPGPGYGFLLEIVSEAPVAEHLEHGVMVGVVAHLLEVIVFSAYPEALLAVRHPRVEYGCIAEEPVLELVHTGVCKHERGVPLYHHRGRGNDPVALRGEEVQELFSNLFRCHIIAN